MTRFWSLVALAHFAAFVLVTARLVVIAWFPGGRGRKP